MYYYHNGINIVKVSSIRELDGSSYNDDNRYFTTKIEIEVEFVDRSKRWLRINRDELIYIPERIR